MNYFSTNLKYLREKRNLEQIELAEMLGRKSSSSISEWEKGKYTPKSGVLSDISVIFGVSLSDLMHTDLTKENYGNSLTKESSTVYNPSTINLPLFAHVAAGALAIIDGVTEENIEEITLSRNFLGKHANSDGLFSMYVNGDSMNKVINHGEIVIAKKLELNEYQAGDIVIFSHNGEYSLKRYAPNEIEGFILFKAESHDSSFKDIAVPKDTTCELKIYGKVIFCGSTF